MNSAPSLSRKQRSFSPHKFLCYVVCCCLFTLLSCSKNTKPTDGVAELHSQKSLPNGSAVVQQDGLQFRDLNRNGHLDIYEDWRLAASQRSEHLVSLMTLEEKAGAMLHASLPSSQDATAYNLEQVQIMIRDKFINSMITRLSGAPAQIATANNTIQQIAENTRLGIPATVSTDPRHHFQFTEGASIAAQGFSQWPELLGFAALNDPTTIQRFADIARQEYRAVGIHMGLSPQADLGTEPRWSRFNGTFGENAELAKRVVQSYIEGFQNGSDGLNADSVALVVKHWVGYGAADKGYDSHNYYGRYAVFPGNNFDYHIIPFKGAFAANVAGVMPTYSILKDLEIQNQKVEQVGAGFNQFLLTDLLRKQYGFDGVILSDWAITRDCPEVCIEGEHNGEIQGFGTLSTAWGAIDLSITERFAKGINAGIDQFGGTDTMQHLADAVHQGLVDETRINESVQRIMQQKFELGLFDNPYVDEQQADHLVGNDEFQTLANQAQRQALVLLENKKVENKNSILPLELSGKNVFLYGINREVAQRYGLTVVDDINAADFAIVRANAPFEILHPNYVFGRMQHEGDLSFKNDNPEYQVIQQASEKIPTIVTVYLDRPAVLTNIKDKATALIGNFGISDAALLDVISGKESPRGKLPFQLPSSMESVEKQLSDVPGDLEEPLYPFGYGLEYSF